MRGRSVEERELVGWFQLPVRDGEVVAEADERDAAENRRPKLLEVVGKTRPGGDLFGCVAGRGKHAGSFAINPGEGWEVPKSGGAKGIQNKKYRCASGRTLAGSQVSTRPSAFTV
jgi:hypothetical protein